MEGALILLASLAVGLVGVYGDPRPRAMADHDFAELTDTDTSVSEEVRAPGELDDRRGE